MNSNDSIDLRRKGLALAIATAISLAACGGDSGGPKNQAPTAAADTATPSVAEFAEVILDASLSSDPEGKDLSFQWTQVSGPQVELQGSDTATATFTAPKVVGAENMEFEVTVSDGSLDDTAQVTVSVSEGSYVLYSAHTGGGGFYEGMYISNVETPEPMELTTDRGWVREMSVSPDHRRVAFVMDNDMSDASSCFSLYVAEVGSQAEMVLDCETQYDDTAGTVDGIGDGIPFSMEWAPDSSRLAFISYQYYPRKGVSNVMTWSPEDGLVDRTGIVRVDEDADGYPDNNINGPIKWSADSQHLLFLHVNRHRGRNLDRLHAVALDGSDDWEISDFSLDILSNEAAYGGGRLVTNADAAVMNLDDMSLHGMSLPDSDVDFDGVADGSIKEFGITPAGRVWYLGDTSTIDAPELHLVDIDGDNHERITSITLQDADENGRADTDLNFDGLADHGVVSARMSPDGNHLAYYAVKEIFRGFVSNPIYRQYIHSFGSTEPDVAVIGDPDAPQFSSADDYHWSLDSGTLVFRMENFTVSQDYRSHDLETGDNTLLTTTSGVDFAELIGWTEGGEPVVALDANGMPATAFVLPLDGSGNQVIVTGGASVDSPWSMSPDGRRFQFAAFDATDSSFDVGLKRIGASGDETVVTRAGMSLYEGSFTPDSRYYVGLFEDRTGAKPYGRLDAVSCNGDAVIENLSGEIAAGARGVLEFEVFGGPRLLGSTDCQ